MARRVRVSPFRRPAKKLTLSRAEALTPAGGGQAAADMPATRRKNAAMRIMITQIGSGERRSVERARRELRGEPSRCLTS